MGISGGVTICSFASGASHRRALCRDGCLYRSDVHGYKSTRLIVLHQSGLSGRRREADPTKVSDWANTSYLFSLFLWTGSTLLRRLSTNREDLVYAEGPRGHCERGTFRRRDKRGKYKWWQVSSHSWPEFVLTEIDRRHWFAEYTLDDAYCGVCVGSINSLIDKANANETAGWPCHWIVDHRLSVFHRFAQFEFVSATGQEMDDKLKVLFECIESYSAEFVSCKPRPQVLDPRFREMEIEFFQPELGYMLSGPLDSTMSKLKFTLDRKLLPKWDDVRNEKLARIHESIEQKRFAFEKAPDLDKHGQVTRAKIDKHEMNHQNREAVVLESKYRLDVEVDQGQIITLQENILTLRVVYEPQPGFSIRDIFAALTEALHQNDETRGYEPRVYHSPSPHQRFEHAGRLVRGTLIRRIAVAFLMGGPTFVIGIVFMMLMPHENPTQMKLMAKPFADISVAQWILFALATPVYFYSARGFHIGAMKGIWSLWKPGSRASWTDRFFRFGNMDALIFFGTSITYLSSTLRILVAVVLTALGKSARTDDEQFFFDTTVFLTFFLLLGRAVEFWFGRRQVLDPSRLSDLIPETAELANNDGSDGIYHRDLIERDDVFWVDEDTAPILDGHLVDIARNKPALFNRVNFTGEPDIKELGVGDAVECGTTNVGHRVKVRASAYAGRCSVDYMISAVWNSQNQQSAVAKVVDRIVAYFVPSILYVSLATWIIWTSTGAAGRLPATYRQHADQPWPEWAMEFGLAVLVIACPCGLGLATPSAIAAGTALASQHGIIQQGTGTAFQYLNKLKHVVFDKTGTLTLDPQVAASWPSRSSAKLLKMICAVEKSSPHPVGKALLKDCKQALQSQNKSHNLEEFYHEVSEPFSFEFGKCLRADFPNKTRLAVGSYAAILRWLRRGTSNEALNPELVELCDEWSILGYSVCLVALGHYSQPLAGREGLQPGQYQTMEDDILNADKETVKSQTWTTWEVVAAIALQADARPESKFVIESLKRRGIQVYMCTGDVPDNATPMGALLGIDPANILAGVNHTDKGDYIRKLQSDHQQRVCMVGDGSNDAQAFQAADVSIAMATGSVLAASSATFLMKNSDDLKLVLLLEEIGTATHRRTIINIVVSAMYNVLAIPIAAGVLYPVLRTASGGHWILDPVFAALAMVLSSLSVAVSSLLLRTAVPVLGFRSKEYKKVAAEQRAARRKQRKRERPR